MAQFYNQMPKNGSLPAEEPAIKPPTPYSPMAQTMDPAALSQATTPTFDDIAMNMAKQRRMKPVAPVAANPAAVEPGVMAQILARFGGK